MGSRFRLLLGAVIGAVVGFWVRTLRVDLEWSQRDEHLAFPRVFAFFHGQQMALLAARQARRTAVVVSRSADGEIQAAVMRRLGFSVVRGSSSRGGAVALRAVVRELSAGRDAALAVDGPRGPRCVAKPGALLAARKSGAVVLPVASAAARVFVLGRAWDRFEIPWPFSRVTIVVGAPIAASAADPSLLTAAIVAARSRAMVGVRDRTRSSSVRASNGAPAGNRAS